MTRKRLYGKPVLVKENSTVSFGPCKLGSRAYLATAGGFDVPAVMESKSTYVRAGIGGLHGRALQKEDELSIGETSSLSKAIISQLSPQLGKQGFAAPKWSVSRGRFLPLKKNPVIRVLEGKQFGFFTEESKTRFYEETFRVTPQSDRMGYRLKGEPLELKAPLEMVSEAVSFGTVQVPPDGNRLSCLQTGKRPAAIRGSRISYPLIFRLSPKSCRASTSSLSLYPFKKRKRLRLNGNSI